MCSVRSLQLAPCLLLLAACCSGAAEPPPSLVLNGGFERGLRKWHAPASGVEAVAVSGRGMCVRVAEPASIVQELYVGANAGTFTAAVDVRAESVVLEEGKPGFAYAAVYQLGTQGELVAYRDFVQLRAAADWQRYTCTVEAAPTAVTLSLRCGFFNARGLAWFDNWTLVAGGKAAEYRDEAASAARGAMAARTVGIVREPGLPVAGAASSPEALAELLRGDGLETCFLSAADLASPAVLQPSRVGVVVLPYGGTFPAPARETFIAYLRQGGCFLTTGGYAFSNLVYPDGNGWVTEAERLRRGLEEARRPGKAVLPDGGFEQEATTAAKPGGRDQAGHWFPNGPGSTIVAEQPLAGTHCAQVRVETAAPGTEVKWDAWLPATPGRRYRVAAAVRAADVSGLGFAYAAVYQYGAGDKLIRHCDFAQVRGSAPWKEYAHEFTAEENVTALYLKCGLYQATGSAWFDAWEVVDTTDLQARPLNTATGRPEDGLVVGPTQIGVFDAGYRLRRVQRVVAAPAQFVVPQDLTLGPVRGWAASAVRGEDATRWIPLLDGVDRYGRSRGPVAAMLLHYGGFYEGSRWAYIGVDDRDVLAPGAGAGLGPALRRVARFLLDGRYLHNLATEYASYAAGTPLRVRVVVEGGTGADEALSVRFQVYGPESSAKPVAQRVQEVRLGADGTAEVVAVVPMPKKTVGLQRVTARLLAGDTALDEMETGCVVMGEASASPRRGALTFSGNYFMLGGRAQFLFGCDNYANVYTSSVESPLAWAREHAACRDFGFQIYENLQYNHPDFRMTEADWRAFSGMAQLTQAYGLVFMPGLLIGQNVAIAEAQVQAQSALCREYAKHLKTTPRLLWYINGDYQLQYPEPAPLAPRWQAFLKETYGTVAALREAWGTDPGGKAWGDLPFPPERTAAWDDARAVDEGRFRAWLTTGWNRAHVAAIRAEDRVHPITSEYYQAPWDGLDLRLTIDGQDVSNIGYFDEPERDLDLLPLRLRWNDMRAQGKSLSLGEYGVKTHPAWAAGNGGRGYHLVRTEEQQKQLFLGVVHYAFGMGASKVQNWCLRDAAQRVFPWGVFYPGPLVPKDVAWTHRNLSLLMRRFAPRYEAPKLTVLLCDHLRLGNQPGLGTDAGYRCFEALLGLHTEFSVLGDTASAEIPAATRVIVYPAAICPPDDAIERLRRWVEAGGVLLLTGDVGFGPNRQHDRTARFAALAGVEWQASLYGPEARREAAAGPVRWVAERLAAEPAWSASPQVRVRPLEAEVLALAGEDLPVLTERALGKGRVVFCSDPLELGPEDAVAGLRVLYDWFLRSAGVPRLQIQPDDPGVHALAQPTAAGTAYVLFDRRQAEPAAARDVVLPTQAGLVTLCVRPRLPAMVWAGTDRTVRVVGGVQRCAIGSEVVLETEGSVTIASLDGYDLRRSRMLLCLPFAEGPVQITTPGRVWKKPVLVLGDVEGGRFRPLDQVTCDPGERLSFSLDADRATLIGVLCEAATATKAVARLQLLVSGPEGLDGL